MNKIYLPFRTQWLIGSILASLAMASATLGIFTAVQTVIHSINN